MITENGWPSCNSSGAEWIKVPGTTVSLQLQKGLPCTIMRALAADFNAYVETLRDADSAAWTPTNSVATSNHLGGTAMDLNWNSHPFQVADAGFNRAQIATARELLDFYEGTVFWANDWDSPKDAMHWQMGYGTFEDQDRLRDFVARKIRADGFSTFRRSVDDAPAPSGLTAETLSAAMGGSVSPDRYRELLPAFVDAMRAADITTVRRAAAWCSQVGHESDGLKYMAEIQTSGPDWSWDRTRYRGRGPIQLTWSSNYAKFGAWCKAKGLVDDALVFVDEPELVEQPKWGFLAAAWYWLKGGPRPGEINAFADAGDVLAVSRCINGWVDQPNGMPDRRARWDRCLALGEALLPGEGNTMAFLDEKLTNWQGNEVSVRDVLFYNDLFIGLILDQLVGPNSRAAGGDPTRWAPLGNRTLVEGMAALGEALKVPGFKAVTK